MRIHLVILATLLGISVAFALPFGHGGGSITAVVCTGTPTPDGCSIFPVSPGLSSSVLTDVNSNQYRFGDGTADGALLWLNSGGGFIPYGHVATAQINSTNQGFIGSNCAVIGGTSIWVNQTHNTIWQSPTLRLGGATDNAAKNVRTGTQYNRLSDALSDAALAANDTVEVTAPTGSFYDPNGTNLPLSAPNNITLKLDAGVRLGCTGYSVYAGLITQGGGSGTDMSGFVLDATAGGNEIAYTPQGTSLLALQRSNGATVKGSAGNLLYIHDALFHCVISSPDITHALTYGPILLDYLDVSGCGETDGNNSAATHNIYIGSLTSGVTVSHGVTDCAIDPSFGGFPLKSRVPTTVYAETVTTISVHGRTDCNPIATIDMSCGGAAVFGQSGAGNGIVLHMGPDTAGTNDGGMIRYANLDGGAPNCNSSPWAGSTITATNGYAIFDGGNASTKLVFDANAPGDGVTGTFTNFIVVCNGLQTCNSSVLGAGMTAPGGTVTYYANRAAAHAAGQTWATACTGQNTSLCPLPAVP